MNGLSVVRTSYHEAMAALTPERASPRRARSISSSMYRSTKAWNSRPQANWRSPTGSRTGR